LKEDGGRGELACQRPAATRRGSRRRGVSFTIELIIVTLFSAFFGLDGTACAAIKDTLSN
jgi:hypothetical protein